MESEWYCMKKVIDVYWMVVYNKAVIAIQSNNLFKQVDE